VGVDQHVHRMRERRSLLNAVVGDQLEAAALRKDSGLIVAGAIFELEPRVQRDPRAMDDLRDVS